MLEKQLGPGKNKMIFSLFVQHVVYPDMDQAVQKPAAKDAEDVKTFATTPMASALMVVILTMKEKCVTGVSKQRL